MGVAGHDGFIRMAIHRRTGSGCHRHGIRDFVRASKALSRSSTLPNDPPVIRAARIDSVASDHAVPRVQRVRRLPGGGLILAGHRVTFRG